MPHSFEVIYSHCRNLNNNKNTCDNLDYSIPNVILDLCILDKFDNDVNIPN